MTSAGGRCPRATRRRLQGPTSRPPAALRSWPLRYRALDAAGWGAFDRDPGRLPTHAGMAGFVMSLEPRPSLVLAEPGERESPHENLCVSGFVGSVSPALLREASARLQPGRTRWRRSGSWWRRNGIYATACVRPLQALLSAIRP
jgi:hypothetical protein